MIPNHHSLFHYLLVFYVLVVSGGFTVFTYNILAEKYATPQLYGYAPSWALSWEYRKVQLLNEILSYDPDIICLQVSTDVYT